LTANVMVVASVASHQNSQSNFLWSIDSGYHLRIGNGSRLRATPSIYQFTASAHYFPCAVCAKLLRVPIYPSNLRVQRPAPTPFWYRVRLRLCHLNHVQLGRMDAQARAFVPNTSEISYISLSLSSPQYMWAHYSHKSLQFHWGVLVYQISLGKRHLHLGSISNKVLRVESPRG
jgi:hypothetical protein